MGRTGAADRKRTFLRSSAQETLDGTALQLFPRAGVAAVSMSEGPGGARTPIATMITPKHLPTDFGSVVRACADGLRHDPGAGGAGEAELRPGGCNLIQNDSNASSSVPD
jgi:hypothetical protein